MFYSDQKTPDDLLKEWTEIEESRAIPLDKSLIKASANDLAQQINTAMERYYPKNVPQTGYKINIASDVFLLKKVASSGTVEISIVVGFDKPENKKSLIAYSGFGKFKGGNDPVISIKLNNLFTADDWIGFFKSGKLEDALFTELLHELTHAADVQSKGGIDNYGKNTTNIDLKTYYNDPHEVRAFMQEIVDIVLKTAPNFERFMPKLSRTKIIQLLVRTTEVWKKAAEYFTDSNKNLIFKAVVKALDDHDLLTGSKTNG
jgi:hypothetical protein